MKSWKRKEQSKSQKKILKVKTNKRESKNLKFRLKRKTKLTKIGVAMKKQSTYIYIYAIK